MRFSKTQIDPALRIVMRDLCSSANIPNCPDVTVTVQLIHSTAESALKLRSPALAALCLAYVQHWDSLTLAAIDKRKTRRLSMTAPLPEPEVKQSTRVDYDSISWAIEGNQPDPVDLLTRQSKCLHSEIHPADVPPTRVSNASLVELVTVHSVFNPENPHAAKYRAPNPNYRMPTRSL